MAEAKEIMTVGQLISLLSAYPAETPVYVGTMEGDYDPEYVEVLPEPGFHNGKVVL